MLEWHSDVARWYLDGRPIHAGTPMDISAKDPDDPDVTVCLRVRIESEAGGRCLYAHTQVAGMDFRRLIACAPENSEPWSDVLGRWPDEENVGLSAGWETYERRGDSDG